MNLRLNAPDFVTPVITGHVLIESMLPDGSDRRVDLDKHNAVHPQNLAWAFAQALAGKGNFSIYRLAVGNGGAYTDAAGNIRVKTPNDGQGQDAAAGWASRLYNETYSEVINQNLSTSVGTDPGSVNGPMFRAGGGSSPAGDSPTDYIQANSLGVISQVVVNAYINPNEPGGQDNSQGDSYSSTDTFNFSELGLYTKGLQSSATYGYQNVLVGTATSSDATNLIRGSTYTLQVTVSGVTRTFTILVPLSGSTTVTYGELCEGLNAGTWVTSQTSSNGSVSNTSTVTNGPYGFRVLISDTTGQYPSIIGAQTNGFLQFITQEASSAATISITYDPTNASTSSLLTTLTGGDTSAILPAVAGANAGVQNDPTNPDNNIERLLTHLTFAPIRKTADRVQILTYTLTIAIPRSASQNQNVVVATPTTQAPLTVTMTPTTLASGKVMCSDQPGTVVSTSGQALPWVFSAASNGASGAAAYSWSLAGQVLTVGTSITSGNYVYTISTSSPNVLIVEQATWSAARVDPVSVTVTDGAGRTATITGSITLSYDEQTCAQLLSDSSSEVLMTESGSALQL